jgi:hypothetical protein
MLIYRITIIMNQDQILNLLYDNSPIYFRHENGINDLNLEIDEKETYLNFVDEEDNEIYINSSKIVKNTKYIIDSSDIDINKKIQIRYNIKKYSSVPCLIKKYKFIAEISENDDPTIKSTLKLITYSIFKLGMYSKNYIKCDTYYSNF